MESQCLVSGRVWTDPSGVPRIDAILVDQVLATLDEALEAAAVVVVAKQELFALRSPPCTGKEQTAIVH